MRVVGPLLLLIASPAAADAVRLDLDPERDAEALDQLHAGPGDP